METYKNFNIPQYVCFLVSFLIPTTLIHANTHNYIVHMDSSAMPKAFSTHKNWHLATLSSVLADSKTTSNSIDSRFLYSYTHVVHGFSAHLSVSELELLKKSPGYISSFKDVPLKLHTTRSQAYLGLNSNSAAWKSTNSGEGIIIGVVDTGVWPESESFKDFGMPDVPKRWKGKCESGTQFNSSLCNKKLIGARFFNKALIANHPNITLSMNSTRDTKGHGTHTASTAAGNFVKNASFFGYAPGTASGSAPRAHVAMYKASWPEGLYGGDVIAAVDQAIIDGVDVLSISLGPVEDAALYEDPMALATFAAIQNNIFVSASAGNRGTFSGTVQNGMPWVLTVAAGTIDRQLQAVLTLGNGESVSGVTWYLWDYDSNITLLVYRGECFYDDLADLEGKIVVCEEGITSVREQILYVSNKNVAGAIFITKESDLENHIQTGFEAVFVDSKSGEIIKRYINSTTKARSSLEFKKTKLGTRAPSVASYTSRGPNLCSPSVLKPDIMAPGSFILAAWPDNVFVPTAGPDVYSKFNIMYGTSMACPHTAGIAALLKKAHPQWSTAAIRSAIMTTADSLDNANLPIRELGFDNRPANPLGMGSGQINPNKALDPGLIYDANLKDYVNLLCAMNFTQKQIQTITKSASNDCSSPSLDLNYPSFVAYFNNNTQPYYTKTQEFHRTVTNVGDPVTTYYAKLTPIDYVMVTVSPTELEFKAKNQKLSYKLVIEGQSWLTGPDRVVSGYLSWVESNGKHIVKSPIAATSLPLVDNADSVFVM